MTFGIKLHSDDCVDSGFTVQRINGCRLVFGSVPIGEFAMLTNGYSKDAQMDAHLADMIGAVLVIGEPNNLAQLRTLNLPISSKRQRDGDVAAANGLAEVAQWLRTGERGLSSNAMCKRMFMLPIDAGNDHPHDPDDLLRCEKFLDATASHDKLHLMSDVSPQWDRLVTVWQNLTSMLNDELSDGATAPRTYALMQAAIR